MTVAVYSIYRRQQPGEPVDPSRGKLVSKITCQDCSETVCIAQTEDWPPTDVVTLHIGRDWPEPQIVANDVRCGLCGGRTTNVSIGDVQVAVPCRGYVDIRFVKVPCPVAASAVESGQCHACRTREWLDSQCRGW